MNNPPPVSGSVPRIGLLACSVFEREIALHAAGAKHILETRFFEIGLHDCPDKLRGTLQQNLEAVDARTDIEAVVLAYGLCGRGTVGLHPLRHKLVIPRAHNCITVFMGSKEAYAGQRRSGSSRSGLRPSASATASRSRTTPNTAWLATT